MNNQGKVYIYNPKQAQFYMQEGIRYIESGIHKVTKIIFWVFEYEDVQDAFTKWCAKKSGM